MSMTKQRRKSELETLAEYISRVRQEKNLTTYDVERRSGKTISQSTVSQIENGRGKSPTIETLRGLAKGLGVPVMELFALAIGNDPSLIPGIREQRVRALFAGVDELDPEMREEIDSALKFIEKAVDSYLRSKE